MAAPRVVTTSSSLKELMGISPSTQRATEAVAIQLAELGLYWEGHLATKARTGKQMPDVWTPGWLPRWSCRTVVGLPREGVDPGAELENRHAWKVIRTLDIWGMDTFSACARKRNKVELAAVIDNLLVPLDIRDLERWESIQVFAPGHRPELRVRVPDTPRDIGVALAHLGLAASVVDVRVIESLGGWSCRVTWSPFEGGDEHEWRSNGDSRAEAIRGIFETDFAHGHDVLPAWMRPAPTETPA